jgi:hypothetical protein
VTILEDEGLNMSNVYRKSFKGIDEVAFKTAGLPMRMMSYLLVVDGESSVDQLVARNPQLPSLAAVLQGLMEQGFLELAGTAANVVGIGAARVANGAPVQNYQQQPMQQPQQQYQPQQQPQQFQNQQYQPQQHPQQNYAQQQPVPSAELEIVKTNMMRDVSGILGADAAPVISKIQGCRTRDELFSTMIGIKKIITIYADRNAADKFGARYNNLSA